MLQRLDPLLPYYPHKVGLCINSALAGGIADRVLLLRLMGLRQSSTQA